MLDHSDKSSTITNTEDTSNMSTLENAENTQSEQEQEQGSTQMPCIPKRKKRQPLQENNNFEKELNNRSPDNNSDDLAFFSSLGPVLKSFDLVQKLQFRSRVLAVAMDIQNMYRRPNSSSTNDTTDNEAQSNYGTQPTYDEEYVPRMYQTVNSE
ncbi:jg21304 [Pararge aegeria aegeria]|uniref:Jg21304 protein n=1 Tax=Pararge aegeria aegeria TaxID=348720 RepID=A0A8S4QWV4_9NEOP|nr:jg21304 [Pararge aegeria aegeria]